MKGDVNRGRKWYQDLAAWARDAGRPRMVLDRRRRQTGRTTLVPKRVRRAWARTYKRERKWLARQAKRRARQWASTRRPSTSTRSG